MNVTTTLPANAQLIHNVAQLTSAETTQQETSLDTPLIGLYVQKSHDPDPVFPGEIADLHHRLHGLCVGHCLIPTSPTPCPLK